jgi:hypothetical protein
MSGGRAPAVSSDRAVEEADVLESDPGGGGGGSYHAFRARQAKGVLYKISAVDGPARARLTTYVHNGAMDADLRYVREVFGLVNTSGRKDFDLFWESPWVEEHVRDTTRKRKLDAQQRAVAVRSYIRASTTAATESENVDKFLETVDRLTEWEDRHGAKDIVKTVSRMVQSFERASIATLQSLLSQSRCASYVANVSVHIDPARVTPASDAAGEPDVTSIACTLRRSNPVFHLFAAVVAAEIIWAEATNGSRNTTIFMCKQLNEKRDESAMALIRCLNQNTLQIPHDAVGLPLMNINASMCVCRGVLVVMPGATSATYILDLADGVTDLSGVRNIRVSHVVEDSGTADQDAAA